MAKIKVKAGRADPVSLVAIAPVDTHGTETLGGTKFSPILPTSSIRYLLVQALAQNVRYTIDGATDPTAVIGFQLVASDPAILIPMGPGVQPQFFREVAGAILEYQWAE